jgi:hypothetical protein
MVVEEGEKVSQVQPSEFIPEFVMPFGTHEQDQVINVMASL